MFETIRVYYNIHNIYFLSLHNSCNSRICEYTSNVFLWRHIDNCQVIECIDKTCGLNERMNENDKHNNAIVQPIA